MSGISAINENTNSRFDNDEYKPDGGNVDVAPRGSKNQQTERNAGLEDRETADSDVTGKIPRRAFHASPLRASADLFVVDTQAR